MSTEPTIDSSTKPQDNNAKEGTELQMSTDSKLRTMKRVRTGCTSSDKNDDSEPEEKRPAFRLQPPTLIHGKAKPVPKQADGELDSSTSKCKFLQPSKLTVPSSSSTAAVDQSSSTAETARIGRPVVSLGNPFLLTAEKENVSDEDKEAETNNDQESGFVFGSNLQERAKVNGSNDASLPDSTTDSDPVDKDKNAHNENLFLQPGDSATSSGTTAEGFVFGRKMEDRATVTTESKASDHQSGDNNGSSVSSSSFVFGENLAERAKVSPKSSASEPISFMPQSTTTEADSSTGTKNSTETAGSTAATSDIKNLRGLEESAAAHFAASQNRTIMPEVEVVTGEENEKNVLQMQCKLYQFEAVTQNWAERGVGILHLNDGNCSDDDLHFQSRLVMRTHGSLRLVLNTKIWAQMTVEKASKKSVRVSAQTGDGKIGVFLITATINDAEQIHRALEYRILHQKQLEEKRKDLEARTSGDSPADAKDSPATDNGEKEKQTPVAAATSSATESPCKNQQMTKSLDRVDEEQKIAPPAEDSEATSKGPDAANVSNEQSPDVAT